MRKTLFSVLTVGKWKVRMAFNTVFQVYYTIYSSFQNLLLLFIILRLDLKLLYGFHTDFTRSIYSVNAGYWKLADRGADVSLIVGQVRGEGWDDCHKPGHKLAITLSLLLYGIRNESLTSQSVSGSVFN